jgi:hypothetical protein
MSIVEDQSGRIFEFVNILGPKFLLHMLVAEHENTAILRISLSMLLLVVAYLRSKLPKGYKNESDWTHIISNTLTDWAISSLHYIADNGSVSVCVNLLLHNHADDIQQLALNLMAHLIAVSEVAGQQILQILEHDKVDEFDDIRHTQSISNEKLDYIKTITGMPTLNAFKDIAEGEAVRTVLLKSANISSRKGKGEAEVTALKPILSTPGSTCLSYVISIAALYRNRVIVMGSCAEIVIALTYSADANMIEEIARTPTVVLKESYVLNEMARQSNQTKRRLAKLEQSTDRYSDRRQQKSIPWACIINFLSFLKRLDGYKWVKKRHDELMTPSVYSYDRPFHQGLANLTHNVTNDDGSSKDVLPKEPITSVPDDLDLVAKRSHGNHKHHDLQDELVYQCLNFAMSPAVEVEAFHAHKQVLIATCVMIAKSKEVSSFVFTLANVEIIIKNAGLLHHDNHEVQVYVKQCLDALEDVRSTNRKLSMIKRELMKSPWRNNSTKPISASYMQSTQSLRTDRQAKRIALTMNEKSNEIDANKGKLLMNDTQEG